MMQVTAALTRLKNCLPRNALDALYGVAELTQTPEFEVGMELYNKIEAAWCYTVPPPAVCIDAQVRIFFIVISNLNQLTQNYILKKID